MNITALQIPAVLAIIFAALALAEKQPIDRDRRAALVLAMLSFIAEPFRIPRAQVTSLQYFIIFVPLALVISMSIFRSYRTVFRSEEFERHNRFSRLASDFASLAVILALFDLSLVAETYALR